MAVDPLAEAEKIVANKANASNTSVLEREPLKTWILGLAALKADKGSLLPWDDIELRMRAAAEAAAEEGAEIFVKREGGRATKPRAVTSDEREACLRYIDQRVAKKPMQTYLKTHHPDLYARVKRASNGRGQGTRPDEVSCS